MSETTGTSFETELRRVEDADTLVVEHPETEEELYVRLLSLDTEETGEPTEPGE